MGGGVVVPVEHAGLWCTSPAPATKAFCILSSWLLLAGGWRGLAGEGAREHSSLPPPPDPHPSPRLGVRGAARPAPPLVPKCHF